MPLGQRADVAVMRREFHQGVDHQAAGRAVRAQAVDHALEQGGEPLADGRGAVELVPDVREAPLLIAGERRLVERVLVAVGVVEALAADAEGLDEIVEGGVLEAAHAEEFERSVEHFGFVELLGAGHGDYRNAHSILVKRQQ